MRRPYDLLDGRAGPSYELRAARYELPAGRVATYFLTNPTGW
jgi:hypothetical protein